VLGDEKRRWAEGRSVVGEGWGIGSQSVRQQHHHNLESLVENVHANGMQNVSVSTRKSISKCVYLLYCVAMRPVAFII